MSWHWLSFADANRPEGEQFLGVAIVEGFDTVAAVVEAHRLRINPGGEVESVEIPDEHLPPAGLRNRLLSREDLRRANLT